MGRLSIAVLVVVLVVSLPAMMSGGLAVDITHEDALAGGASLVTEPTAGQVNAGSPVPTTATQDQQSKSLQQDETTIHKDVTVRQLPERPGEIELEVTFSISEYASSVLVEPDDDWTVEDTGGFDRVEGSSTACFNQVADSAYEWDGETDDPTVRVTVPANETQAGEYTFVETGSWGIVQVPRIDPRWCEPAHVSLTTDRSVSVDGPGAAGSDIAVLDEVDEYTATAGSESHRLVVPASAALKESPEAILETLGDAQEHLQIANPQSEVFFVAAPTGDVEWYSQGVQFGEGDAWVRDDAALETAGNVWIHEYVHVRQAFAGVADGTESDARWLIEGQADYYAALIAYETGLTSYEEFRSFVERGQTRPHDDGILAQPSTWPDRFDYARGPLALAAIDRELRLETGGDRTLVDVFRTLNRVDQPVTADDFAAAVADAGGPETEATAERYTQTDAIPDTWSLSDHQEAFDQEAATFSYGFEPDDVTITGDSRELSAAEIPTVVPGETVRIPVRAENDGERAGQFTLLLYANGEVVAEVGDSLDVGESSVETVEWTPEKPGSYELRVGDDTTSVTVQAKPQATITDLSLSTRTAETDETVTATVTVDGDDELPAATEVVIATFDDDRAHEETVELGPGETTTVEADLSFSTEGRHEVTAGDQRATLAVGTTAIWVDRVDRVIGSSQFPVAVGALATLMVLLVLISVVRRLRR